MFWRVQIAVAVAVQLDNFAYTHPYSSVEHHIGVAAERPAGSMVVVRCDEAIAERCDLVWKETKDHLQTFQPRSCGCDLCLGNRDDLVRTVLQLLLRVAVAKERARLTMNSWLHCSATVA